MKTKIYRFIDAFVGIPLWLVLGFVSKILPHKNGVPRKIILLKIWAIGDSVQTLPMLRALRQKFPVARIDVLARNRTKDIFLGNKDINNIYLYEMGDISFLKLFRKYDLAIDCDLYLRVSALLSWFLAPERIGFSNQARSTLYTKKVQFKKNQHVVQSYLDLVRILGCEYDEDKLVPIFVGEKEKSKAEKFFTLNLLSAEDFVVGICPGSGESAKTRIWPKENYAQLINELTNRFNAKVILVGGKDEVEVGEELEELTNQRVINAINKYSLKESVAIIEKCKLFISNDTGPMHIAAAQGVTTIGLFGPNTPVLWKPYGSKNFAIYKNVPCSPCINNTKGYMPDCLRTDDKYLCMRLITVDDVVRITERVLKS